VQIQIINNKYNVEFQYIKDEERLADIKELFLEYAEELVIDLDFQDFKEELEKLPGKYGPPDGLLILALIDDKAVGCIALRKISVDVCEMKRLYVKPKYRGHGIGRRLVEILIKEAKELNYDYMRLDTIPSLKKAQNLYESIGFYDIDPYVYNPTEGARFMELELENTNF